MSVDKHIDKSLLFREGFPLNNRLYTHLISGRSIHFFLQFVEPELLKAYPDYHVKLTSDSRGHTKQGAIDLSVLGRKNYVSSLAKTISSERLSDHLLTLEGAVWQKDYLLYCSDNNYDFYSEILKKACNYITDFDLDFFLKLAIGFVAVDESLHRANFSNYILLERKPYNTEELAKILLSEAVKSYLSLCLRTELSKFNSEEGLLKYIPLLQIFSKSVLHELYLRSGNILFKLDEIDSSLYFSYSNILSYLNSLEEVPLSSELVACWYPFWDRSLFIFNSPFDRKNSIL
ncbi:hypothetical protein [Spirosoma foliorum]|uniref:Uncharacterized protein n=1 Tax=Spirosoma foliorum TaxID=2710596 RepID=A0A7G5GRH2_9BACT|nr:hypothetical protein [Spirosoma foliorum]QMW01464.1 hypothetical protein H3H32_26405 [Spirosoma foliorum]